MALPEGLSDLLPLSPAQQGMLFHIMEASTTRARYVAVVSLRINGTLDPSRFRSALEETVDAHSALKASFILEKVKSPIQAIRTKVDLPFVLLDWTTDSNAETRLKQLQESERHREFDLATAPLMLVKLVKLESETYELVWTVQHLVSDGWSMRVVLDEVFTRYYGGKPQPSAQLRDYLVWMKKRPALDSDLFWQSHLANFTPCLSDLPAEPEPFGESVLHAHLSTSFTAQIDSLAKRLRITQNALLASVWALTLRIIARSNDVIFGMSSAGRPAQIPGIGQAVGAFVNTLPIRHIIAPNQTAESFLVNAGKLHQTRSIHDLAGLSHVQTLAKVPAGTALFDTLFVHQGLPAAQSSYDDFDIGAPSIRQSSNFALSMLARPYDGLELELIYDEARVAGYVAQGVIDLYQRLLDAIVLAPTTQISALLPDLDSPQSAGTFKCCLQRFVEQAEKAPDAIAITDASGSLSYGAALKDAKRIASALKQAGLNRDELVPVALPRGKECVVVYLGVLLAGGAYVPIDLDYPKDRIAQVLAAISPKLIISDDSTNLPTTATIIDPKTPATPIEPQEGELAYVIFTSGSQGVPKGVEITRDSLAYSIGVRGEVFHETPGTFLLLSSLAFDSSVAGVFWTLATGGQLVISVPRAEQNPIVLGELIKTHNISYTLCLPGLYDALLKAFPDDKLKSLKTVILAGEPLSPDLPAKHRETLPNVRLFNEYGPTEGTVWCAAYDATDHTEGPVPIGSAPPGSLLQPCDLDGRPLPAGLIGELWLTGPGVARGYYNDPDQTKARFLGGRFRTGDLGFERPDGNIEFLGRGDNQVKIRGHRVELGDVEAAARAVDPAPTYAAVTSDLNGARRITLFAETLEQHEQLRIALSDRLPSYAVPSDVRSLPILPRLPNGKVDQASLSVLAQEVVLQTSSHPLNELEVNVAQLWAEVLNVKHVSRDDNFFDIGGDSLKSISLFALAEARGLQLQPTDIFEHQTVSELAQQLVRRNASDVDHTRVAEFLTANLEGDKTPVFILHANTGVFRNLVNGLGPRRPVALLFSHHFEGVRPPKNVTIESLASDAIKQLQSIRPHGPYALCGYSTGAFIALEMATQLRARGDEVRLLSLIDPPFGLPPKHTMGLRDRVWVSAKAGYRVIRPFFQRVKSKRRKQFVNTAYARALGAYALPLYDGVSHVQLTPENLAMDDASTLAKKLPNVSIDRHSCSHAQLLTSPTHSLMLVSRIIANLRKAERTKP